jgi:hypothetical protein
MGFEPTRAEHNGLAVHRLNHSATSSIQNENFENYMSFDKLNQDESNGTIFIMKRALNIIFSIFGKYYKKKFFY